MQNKIQSRKKAGLIIVLLILMFIVPVMLAKFFYSHQKFLPNHRVNHGQLLNPPLTIDNLNLSPAPPKSVWLLISVQNTACDQDCEQHLFYMRQIQQALGKNLNRLQRVVVTNQPQADKKLVDLLNGSYRGTLLLQINSQEQKENMISQGWYLVDPQGNIMMRYQANAKPDDILDDLEYLLRISQIG